MDPIRPDIIKYEMRGLPDAQPKKKGGGFSRFLSGVGRILGAPLMALGAVFPPLALAGIGAYAGASIGDIGQARHAAKNAQAEQAASSNVFYPGMDLTPPSDDQRQNPVTTRDHVMNVLYARGDTMAASMQEFRG